MSQFKGSIQQMNSFAAILLFCDNYVREFVQNVPAKSEFLQMCLADNLPDCADCGGLPGALTSTN